MQIAYVTLSKTKVRLTYRKDLTMMGITPKQKKFLEFVYKFSREHGYAPSQKEIANHFGWRSLGTVQDYLKKLREKGLLHNRWNARRALEVNSTFARLIAPKVESQEIPIVGRIAAGKPIEAVEESANAVLPIPSEMLPKGDFFALEVEGTSMIEEGILPNDNIIVQKQETADDGDMVVALLDKEATVKKLYRHKNKLELRPANKEMKSIWVKPSACKIQGIVVGLYRSYYNVKND